VVLLTTVGDHVPATPLFDVLGKVGAAVPLQKAGIGVKVGVTDGLTVTLKLAVVAHCPALGVKL
jgi:hypothetical protein